MSIQRILVADDEESIRWVLLRTFRQKDLTVDLAEDGEQALQLYHSNKYDLILLDIKMPVVDGLSVLREIHGQTPELPVVMMTAETTMSNAIDSMKLGAFDYITKPFNLDELEALIIKVINTSKLSEEVDHLRNALKGQFEKKQHIIGNSPSMQQIYKTLGRIAPSDMTVLITGESGTGKELIAKALHLNSPRISSPFIALNCAAIPRELLESELFGFEKGAFTGAVNQQAGKFEQAAGGTLFLDEIGDMPLELQAKILRVLQEREVTRMGGSRSIPVDVRILAATNQGLQELVDNKLFREDLFYRLNVLNIHLPPLRERKEDIPLLAEFFLQRGQQEFAFTAHSLDREAVDLLKKHHWPGNIRELENTIQRAALLSAGNILTIESFPELFTEEEREQNSDSLEALIDKKLRASLSGIEVDSLNDLYTMVLYQMERPLINIILEKTRGNQVRTAEILGINRNTLRKKIQSLNIQVKRDKNDSP